MTLWKLTRQFYGTEEFSFREGDQVTIGRNIDNVIALTSIVISRNHCLIKVEDDKILITDLKSSNGVFVNSTRIPPNVPCPVKDSDVIGLGWALGARYVDVNNKEKYVFKLTKERTKPSVIERIQFQNEDDDDLEEQLAGINGETYSSSPILVPKPQLKRKSEEGIPIATSASVIDLVSDSDSEVQNKEVVSKKIKLETINEVPVKETIKEANKNIECDIFSIKKEFVDYDEDEAIQIDSDSDSESDHWIMRLSQSSPGKPFIKANRESKSEIKTEDNSYSQIEDDLVMDDFLKLTQEDEDEEYLDDIITIPTEPPAESKKPMQDEVTDSIEDPITLPLQSKSPPSPLEDQGIGEDLVDGASVDNTDKTCVSDDFLDTLINKNLKHTRLIEAQPQLPKKKIVAPPVVEKKSSPTGKRTRQSHKDKRQSNCKIQITNSQKEERKKKLKEIATKDKDISKSDQSNAASSNKVVAAKVSTSSRGAFLTDVVEAPAKSKSAKSKKESKKSNQEKVSKRTSVEKKDNSKIISTEKDKRTETSKRDVKSSTTSPEKSNESAAPSKSSPDESNLSTPPFLSPGKTTIPLNKLKPLTGTQDIFSGKPCSMVQPLPPVKPKKKVRFSENKPEVHTFEIEPGNKMKKTSLVKSTLVDSLRRGPVYSINKLTLMKILRWNPQWFEEQVNNNEPPPILGHNDPPMSIFHHFKSHQQYMQQVGDLLLMEIWECLTQGYQKARNLNRDIEMRIESMPPVPIHERSFDLFTISVNVSMKTTEVKNLFRVGDILLVRFGQEAVKNLRLFYVHNIKNLPARTHNKNSFFSVSIQTIFTDKMKYLRLGELMIANSLDHVNKELQMFEAMAYLAKSPLGEVILRPHPMHFSVENSADILKLHNSSWTEALNPSQISAVAASVSAALSDRPSIQMIQGPPGTGKSSVITSIVMSYLYDSEKRRLPQRGKMLICATSNAAVDELVQRLLHIRQGLPKGERFRMVRVGREDAMSARAREVSSQHLAARDARQLRQHRDASQADAEISHLEAKINMWRTAASDAKDAERIAYCQGRMAHLASRISLLRSGTQDLRPEHLIHAEKRIIEGADIVATTLASAQNNKMRTLKGCISLCIVDEAGQAIEPETLGVLALNVTHLTLVGDPQQLPGYICSQRARKHGLGESLFARLTSAAEQWPTGSPVVVLNQQYRMHAHIAHYPNTAFYGGVVRTRYRPPPPALAPQARPYTLLAIASGDKGQVCGANEMEAWGVARVALALATPPASAGAGEGGPAGEAAGAGAGGARRASLAIITPYNAQKDLIRKHLRLLADPESPVDIEVNTVDSFQGQERDVVVVSLARSAGVGFLTDCGRINVMLTRARHALVLCLNPAAVLSNHQWRTLVEDAQRRGLYRTLPNKLCRHPGAGPAVSHAEVLEYLSGPDPSTKRT